MQLIVRVQRERRKELRMTSVRLVRLVSTFAQETTQ
jgi:hypothetical protein